jgi:hypothetical protein
MVSTHEAKVKEIFSTNLVDAIAHYQRLGKEMTDPTEFGFGNNGKTNEEIFHCITAFYEAMYGVLAAPPSWEGTYSGSLDARYFDAMLAGKRSLESTLKQSSKNHMTTFYTMLATW